MVQSNEIVKKEFSFDRDGVPLEKVFSEPFEGKSDEFQNFKNKINPNNLIYKYKTEG